MGGRFDKGVEREGGLLYAVTIVVTLELFIGN